MKKEVTCEVCGESFLKEQKYINLGKRHACSRKCASWLANKDKIIPPSSNRAKAVRNDKLKNPHKKSARELVRRAIKNEQIVPSSTCEDCGILCNAEAHHEDHSRPYLIRWLCKRCHKWHDKEKLVGFGTDYSDQIL
jgi:hypothetical protein